MNPCPRLGVALLLSLPALPAWAASAAYELDPVHTRVMIAVEHAGFSKAIGTVSGSNGHLQFDPENWTTARLEVSVPLQRLDLGDEKWNQAVLARNLLDVEEFPTATFVSTRIEPIDPQHASVYGTLTLHGVPKEVKLEVTLNALKRHPLPPFRRTAGFSATATLSRADFGIDAWKSVIGDRVDLRLEVEATRTRKDDDDNDEHDGAQPPATPPITPTQTAEPATP
ncbi:YceI family protein [Pseudoxanthomonas sacheonensis]|uniref:Polyisoprenoid-binding protein YceI n=1 Tax=Pseudoxanthomonas sacheonensis TaxID=443615 RepID=A0ABU1RMA8_9GAMM|nr:YceI family protein [Pseudoxanthomonas sacheonensis]MDR6839916.1 polyisoprenoid-binding protein YceI [Pseudoxanthomonas sacheonensis]